MTAMVQLEWDIDEAECFMLLVHPTAHAMLDSFWKLFGYGFKEHMTSLDEKSVMKWCFRVSELRSVGNKLIDDMLVKDTLHLITHGFSSDYEHAQKFFNNFPSQGDLLGMDDQEFLRLFEECYRIYFSIWTYGLTVEPIDLVLEERFRSALAPYSVSEQDFQTLITIPEQSFLNVWRKDLLLLAQNIKQNNLSLDLPSPQILTEIHALQKKWCFIKSGHSGRVDLTPEQILLQLKDIFSRGCNLALEIAHIEQFHSEICAKKKKIIAASHFDSSVLNMLKIIDEWGPMHDLRKKMFMQMVYVLDTLVLMCAERNGVSPSDIHLYTYDDIRTLMQGTKISEHDLSLRRTCFVYYAQRSEDGKVTVTYMSGAHAQSFEEKLLGLSQIKQTAVVKGRCGNRGTASGRVCIVVRKEDLLNMQKGDILVSTMTRPELVSAMEKASAIVTDEGGITSHAAIVSRELGIPCVLGTIVGTRVLKDGDLVEVDAEKGEVRKL